jgi:hypothetical protein
MSGGVAYREEQYTLAFGAWTSSSTVVPGTNGSPESVVTSWAFEAIDDDLTVSELSLSVGVTVAFDAERWSCYGRVTGFPYSSVEVSGTITAGGVDHDIDLERAYFVSGIVGGSVSLGDRVCLFAEGEVGATDAIRLGGRVEL